MAKQRFREVKQGKKKSLDASPSPKKLSSDYASSSLKIKAFLTDSFMLLMPILYIAFYLIMDGREDFAAHKFLGWASILIPLVLIQTAFMFVSGQTPGYRNYHIKLIDIHTQQKPSLPIILFRNLCALLSFFTLFGWLLMFFRKDAKTLHDLLSATAVVPSDVKRP